jgi:hypothetical protein
MCCAAPSDPFNCGRTTSQSYSGFVFFFPLLFADYFPVLYALLFCLHYFSVAPFSRRKHPPAWGRVSTARRGLKIWPVLLNIVDIPQSPNFRIGLTGQCISSPPQRHQAGPQGQERSDAVAVGRALAGTPTGLCSCYVVHVWSDKATRRRQIMRLHSAVSFYHTPALMQCCCGKLVVARGRINFATNRYLVCFVS